MLRMSSSNGSIGFWTASTVGSVASGGEVGESWRTDKSPCNTGGWMRIGWLWVVVEER